MIYFQNYSLRNKNISFLKFISNHFYIGYDDGFIEVYTEDFDRIYSKKIHSTIIFDMYRIDSCIITMSLMETYIWDLEWNQKKKIVNILFHRICPLHEHKIIFGTISGDLFSWNEKELKPLPYSFHRLSLLKLYRINKQKFISYTPTEIILWEKELKRYHEKKDREWISTIELFHKDYLLIGHNNIKLVYLPTFEIKKQWSSFPSIITSILSLDYSSFLTISITGYIYLYHIEKNTEECIQKGFGHDFFPISFIKSKRNIYFFFNEFIFEFRNPILLREEENYNLFLNSIENLKKDCIFHFNDISNYIKSYLY